MALQHAVLALLTSGEGYGYELKSAFEAVVGPQWGELNIGHLYQILDRLRREGLVTGHRVRQAERPDKTVYRLTAEGRAELDRWLATPSMRRAGYRDDFFLKLFAAARLGEEPLRALLSRQRAALFGELRVLSDMGPGLADQPLNALLVDAAIAGTRASLAVLDRAAEQAAALAAAAREAAPGVGSRRPGKGYGDGAAGAST